MDWQKFRLSKRLNLDAETVEEFYGLIAEIDAAKRSWRLTGRFIGWYGWAMDVRLLSAKQLALWAWAQGSPDRAFGRKAAIEALGSPPRTVESIIKKVGYDEKAGTHRRRAGNAL
jgi:hypothetical protein